MADIGATTNGAGPTMGGEAPTAVLLEVLLRALAHDPARLDEVHSLLHDLGEGAEAEGRIPAGLMRVWPAIWAAREALRA